MVFTQLHNRLCVSTVTVDQQWILLDINIRGCPFLLLSVFLVFKKEIKFPLLIEGCYGAPEDAWLISFVLTCRLCLVLAEDLGARLHSKPIFDWNNMTSFFYLRLMDTYQIIMSLEFSNTRISNSRIDFYLPHNTKPSGWWWGITISLVLISLPCLQILDAPVLFGRETTGEGEAPS